ncbi:hypothetical protein CDAR_620791 [Caerostris darwini]|uniref:Uncharacterized protein n=1 Tax=Caerostris darwini TaxID=1538125 RepID=A0AAV4URF1_9ARAC|nr:hypothetical protein CDAR_620791 [Caerostris darwini]
MEYLMKCKRPERNSFQATSIKNGIPKWNSAFQDISENPHKKRPRSYLDAPKKVDTMANLPPFCQLPPPKRSRGRSSSDKRAVGFWLTIAPDIWGHCSVRNGSFVCKRGGRELKEG